MSTFPSEQKISPWRTGWFAARANLIPGIVLQVIAVALLAAYYASPRVEEALIGLQELKAEYGFLFSAVVGASFCGFLPWLLRMLTPALRPESPKTDLIFSLFWWAWMNVQTDVFYRAQAFIWGDGVSPAVVAAKVATDMLLYTPAIASPMNAVAHLWKASGFNIAPMKTEMGRGWYRRLVMPNLVPNWMIWTPGVIVVYSLPVLLQIPMASFIGGFWALLCVSVAATQKK